MQKAASCKQILKYLPSKRLIKYKIMKGQLVLASLIVDKINTLNVRPKISVHLMFLHTSGILNQIVTKWLQLRQMDVVPVHLIIQQLELPILVNQLNQLILDQLQQLDHLQYLQYLQLQLTQKLHINALLMEILFALDLELEVIMLHGTF